MKFENIPKDIILNLNDIGLEPKIAVDISSIIVDLRPKALIHLPAALQNKLERYLNHIGLKIINSRLLYKKKDKNSRESFLYSEKMDGVEEWVEIWISKSIGISEYEFDNPGKYLSYPECCIKFYEKSRSMSEHYKNYLLSKIPRFWQLNRMITIFSNLILMPDFFPCSLSCRNALKFVEPYIELSKYILEDSLYHKTIDLMKCPIVIWQDNLILFEERRIENNKLTVHTKFAKSVKIKDILNEDIFFKQPYIINFTHINNDIEFIKFILSDNSTIEERVHL